MTEAVQCKLVREIPDDPIALTQEIQHVYRTKVDAVREYKDVRDFKVNVEFIGGRYLVVFTWKEFS